VGQDDLSLILLKNMTMIGATYGNADGEPIGRRMNGIACKDIKRRAIWDRNRQSRAKKIWVK
jgi:hypothetical protein